jgi:hypothetical protein
MFTADTMIDTIQNGKKQFVKTFVTNEHIAESMNQFIDTQAEYTKKAFKATTDASNSIMTESVKLMRDTAKFDYVKFGEGIMKAYQATGTGKTKGA